MFIQIFIFMCGCGMKQSTNPLSGTICTYTTEPSVLSVTLIIVCEFEVSLFVHLNMRITLKKKMYVRHDYELK